MPHPFPLPPEAPRKENALLPGVTLRCYSGSEVRQDLEPQMTRAGVSSSQAEGWGIQSLGRRPLWSGGADPFLCSLL